MNIPGDIESGSALGSGSGSFNNTTVFDLEDNVTLSCAAKNIQDSVIPPYSTTGMIIVRALYALFQLLTFFAGGFLNLFVILLVAKYKKLQTVSFGIALQIVVLDLVFSTVVSLVNLTNSIANRWAFGEHMCVLIGMAVSINIAMRTVSMLVFVVDRFLLVFCPFAYPKYQFKTVVILSIASWLLVIVVDIIGNALDCYTYVPLIWLCVPAYNSCNSTCSVFWGLNAVGIIIPCRITPLFLYAMLFIKARKARKATASLARTVGSGSIIKYDWKATITFFNIFMSLFAFSLPSIAFFVFTGIFYPGERVSVLILSVAAGSSVSLLTISDPIFIIRNGDMKEAIGDFKAMLRRKYRRK